MTPGDPPVVAALVQDLMFSSRIADALRRLGLDGRICARADAFEQTVRATRPSLALIDLGLRSSDWADAVARLRSDPKFADFPIVAFGPHRDLDLRERALAAGCTEVVANSKFVVDLPHIIARYLGATPSPHPPTSTL